MARVVLHGTSFSLSITLLKTVLDQWEGEFLQLGPSRTRALFYLKVAKNECNPVFETLVKVLQITKFSLVFKETDVLPRKLPNFGKTNIPVLAI